MERRRSCVDCRGHPRSRGHAGGRRRLAVARRTRNRCVLDGAGARRPARRRGGGGRRRAPTAAATGRRALRWLRKRRAPEGSCHTKTRLYPPAPLSPPYYESGLPYGHDQFLSAQGGAWADIALAYALGPAKKVVPEPLPGVAPGNVEPWPETVLFGTAADVKKLLAGGFDPNSATKSGGTTALMMAAPDADKMTLLIERGANVNARSETKYTALMVAAQYGIHSTPEIRLLLSHGADAGQSQGRPLFNADPLFLAAYSGNPERLPDLLKAGASLNGEMTLIGTSNSDALSG